MTLEQDAQVVEEGVIDLAPPFWGKPRITTWLAIYLERLQALEDDTWAVLEDRTIETGDMVRLKVIGRLIGQPRLGFELEPYRALLRARAIANVSKGRGSDIVAALKALGFDVSSMSMVELGNANLYVSVGEAVAAGLVDAAVVVLPDVRAAGVGMQFLYGSDADVGLWGTAVWGTSTWGGARRV